MNNKVDIVVDIIEKILPDGTQDVCVVENKLSEFMGNQGMMAMLGISVDSEEWNTIRARALRKLESNMYLTIAPPCKIFNPNVRDWLTADRKKQIEWNYWERYKKHLAKKLAKAEVAGIDNDTNEILSLMADPTSDEDYGHKGLVVGDVQSGKTANYAGLICKAIDAGYKIIIVIAGVLSDLRAQTQERLDRDVIGVSSKKKADKTKKYGVGAIPSNIGTHPHSLTTYEQDFHIRKSSDAPNPLDGSVYMLVIKKNSKTLSNVISFFSQRYTVDERRNSPVLILDDEADNASVNSNASEEAPTKINELIKKLLGLFPRNSYVGYTATPYANIFIDPYVEQGNNGIEQDLFPSDFIYTLGTSSNYIGATKLFCKPDEEDEEEIDNMSSNAIVTINEDKFLKNIKEEKYNGTSIPESLIDAVYAFVLARVMRDIKGQEKEHCSMLIHISLKKSSHAYLKKAVEEKFDELKNAVISNIALPDPHTTCPVIARLKKVWEDVYENSRVTVTWERIVEQLASNDLYMFRFKFFLVNSDQKKDKQPILDYDSYEDGLTAIVIGGNSLSRGLTIEGLTTTYFLRSAKQYDTLMQMGRWFGYRPDYEEICRIFMPSDLQRHFAAIAMATEELKETIDSMHNSKLTPMDFGLRVRNDISGLSITARNKMRAAAMHDEWVSFGDSLLETFEVSNNNEIIARNLERFYTFIERLSLDFPERKCGEDEMQRDRIWENIPSSLIWNFIDSCEEMYCSADHITSQILKATLHEYMLKDIESFDVALVGVEKQYSWTREEYVPQLKGIYRYPSRNPVQNLPDKDYIIFNKQHVFSKDAEFGYQKKAAIEQLKKKYPKGISGKQLRAIPNRKPLFLISFVRLPHEYISDKKLKDYSIDELTKIIPVFGVSFPKTSSERPKWVKWAYNAVAQQHMEQYWQNGESDIDETEE